MKRLTLSVSMQPVGDGKIIPPIATVAADDGFSGREVLGSELSKKGSGRLSLFAAPPLPQRRESCPAPWRYLPPFAEPPVGSPGTAIGGSSDGALGSSLSVA